MSPLREMLETASRCHRAGNIKKAQSLYLDILKQAPQQPDALHALGIIAYNLNDFGTATRLIQKAIEIRPSESRYHYNLGIIFLGLGDETNAVGAFQTTIKLDPLCSEAHYNLGLAFKKMAQFEKAVSCFNQSISINPDDADAHYNLANTYTEMGLHEAAITCYESAIDKNPKLTTAFNNLGLALKAINRIDEAIDHFRKAVQIHPDFVDAQWNLSLALLLNGNFDEGWKKHEYRFLRGKKTTLYPYQMETPRWNGLSFKQKRLFVHSEQGLGDTIQFVRYLPMVKSRGGRVVFETSRPLLRILNGFPGVDELVEMSSERSHAAECEYHVPMMSLPMIFGTDLSTIPSDIPYLFAESEKTRHWHKRMNREGFKIGIVWAGKPDHGNDKNRSCDAELFIPILKLPSTVLYALQTGIAGLTIDSALRDMDNFFELGPDLDDFSDTAAVIKNLDLIISVDTAVAHLAGAMGKPVWTLLPFVPDWRWLLEREDTPWYPTMRLFRQPEAGRWDLVLESVILELKKSLASKGFSN